MAGTMNTLAPAARTRSTTARTTSSIRSMPRLPTARQTCAPAGTLAITGRGLTRGAVAAVLQPAGLLREGNAMMNVGFAVASVGGAALAGLLIAAVGVATALFVDAASFLVIAALLAALASQGTGDGGQ